jgi:hypothetical protein
MDLVIRQNKGQAKKEQGKTRPDQTRPDKIRPDKARQDKTRHEKTIHGHNIQARRGERLGLVRIKAMQDWTYHDKDKTRQEKDKWE